MNLLFLFFSLFALSQGCTIADKVKCTAAMVGCGAICICDIPACECCVPCMACVTATVADCCDCLFPGWSGCSAKLWKNMTYIKPQGEIKTPLCRDTCSMYLENDKHSSICCAKDQTAKCDNIDKCHCTNEIPVFNNKTKIKECQEACASCMCPEGAGQICCPAGKMATCRCSAVIGQPLCACV